MKNSPQLEDLRKRLLSEPISFFEELRQRLLTEEQATPASLTRLADATYELGYLTSQIGDQEEALRALGESRAAYERLVEKNPDDVRSLVELAGCYNCMGILLLDSGRTTDARQAHESALTIWKKVAESDPDNQGAQHWITRTQVNLGMALRGAGKPGEALPLLVEASERLKRVVETPYGKDYQSDLLTLYGNIALVHAELGNGDAVLASLERAKEIAAPLILSRRDDAEFQKNWGNCNTTSDSIITSQGDLSRPPLR